MGLGEYEALVLGDLYEVDVVGGGDGEEAALPGNEEQVGHLSLLLQLQGQLNAGPPVHQHSPALPKNSFEFSSMLRGRICVSNQIQDLGSRLT